MPHKQRPQIRACPQVKQENRAHFRGSPDTSPQGPDVHAASEPGSPAAAAAAAGTEHKLPRGAVQVQDLQEVHGQAEQDRVLRRDLLRGVHQRETQRDWLHMPVLRHDRLLQQPLSRQHPQKGNRRLP